MSNWTRIEPSAGALAKPSPHPLQLPQTCSTIPLYDCEGDLAEWITPRRLAILENGERIRVVKNRKGETKRAYLHRRSNDPTVLARPQVSPTYSFLQKLPIGARVWSFQCLGGPSDGRNLAPVELRPIFLAVLLSCLERRLR